MNERPPNNTSERYFGVFQVKWSVWENVCISLKAESSCFNLWIYFIFCSWRKSLRWLRSYSSQYLHHSTDIHHRLLCFSVINRIFSLQSNTSPSQSSVKWRADIELLYNPIFLCPLYADRNFKARFSNLIKRSFPVPCRNISSAALCNILF